MRQSVKMSPMILSYFSISACDLSLILISTTINSRCLSQQVRISLQEPEYQQREE